jgi:KDO2-lipid IV(A) lauroyltransferase
MKLVIQFIKLISTSPTWILYIFSNLLSKVILRIIPYRKGVVEKNLKSVFPSKSESEIRSIRLKYNSFFTDLMVEGLKQLTISKEELIKRMKFSGIEQVDALIDSGRSCLVICYHYSNWEWTFVGYSASSKQALDGIYQPMSNTHFGELIKKSRSRFGATMIPMQKTYEYMNENSGDNPYVIGLIPDQSPIPMKGYWMEFLGKATPVYRGPENLARTFNLPVFTVSTEFIKQGYYSAKVECLTMNPQDHETGWITEEFMKRLEKKIRKDPAVYLWSHKRWKHDMPADLPENQISKRYPPPKENKINY